MDPPGGAAWEPSVSFSWQSPVARKTEVFRTPDADSVSLRLLCCSLHCRDMVPLYFSSLGQGHDSSRGCNTSRCQIRSPCSTPRLPHVVYSIKHLSHCLLAHYFLSAGLVPLLFLGVRYLGTRTNHTPRPLLSAETSPESPSAPRPSKRPRPASSVSGAPVHPCAPALAAPARLIRRSPPKELL